MIKTVSLAKLFIALVVFLATASASSLAVTVYVSSPSTYNVSTSFTVKANATSSSTVTGWAIYIDGNTAYKTPGPTSSISVGVSVGSGTHSVVVKAWDSSGASGSKSFSISASGTSTTTSSSTSSTSTSSGSLPTPPSTAKVFYNIEDMSGVKGCSAGCAGGQSTSNYWMAQYQGSPSLDGSSTQFFNGGAAWANVLWYKSLGAYDWASHFLWDFWIRFDSTSIAYLHSAEYDFYQSIGGIELMAGTQCNFGNGVWDTWNQSAGHWVATSIPCHRFSGGTWHHIQWYITRPSSKQYKYVTLVVDGTPYSVNQTYYGNYQGWSDKIGVQWQLDLGPSGVDAHEWIDKVKLTIW